MNECLFVSEKAANIMGAYNLIKKLINTLGFKNVILLHVDHRHV